MGTSHPSPRSAVGDLFTCDPSVAVGDAVSIIAPDTVGKAFAGLVAQTNDAIGIVVEKTGTTTARVVGRGRSAESFTGLTVDQVYWLSDTVPGGITDTAPSSPGTKIQEIGTGLTSSTLFIDVDQTSVEIL